MVKVSFKATELVGTDVERVAMVNKAASRLPFRIMKSENEEVINLATLLKSAFPAAVKTGGVYAAVVAKGADLEAAKEVLKAAGLNVDDGKDVDGNTVFQQPGVDEFDQGLMKLNDEVALVVSGLTKSFSSYDFESTSFGELVKTGSFYPSIRSAADVLVDVIHNIMWEADSPSEAATAISKAAGEFQSYANSLANALPVQAFKADVTVQKGDKAGKWVDGKWVEDEMKTKDKAKAKKSEVISTSPTHGNDPIDKNMGSASNDIENNPAHGNGTPSASGGKQASPGGNVDNSHAPAVKTDEAATDPTTEAPKTEDVTTAALASLTKALQDGLASIQTSMNEQVAALKTDIGTVAADVKKAEAKINGTVVVEAEGDQTGVTKSEKPSKGAPPLLDTAHDRSHLN